jgi:hypothetical protein
VQVVDGNKKTAEVSLFRLRFWTYPVYRHPSSLEGPS